MKMKNLIYKLLLLASFGLLCLSCDDDSDLTVYSTDGATTELGRKIIAGSESYVGHFFSDTSYVLTPGVTALEMEILSFEGRAVKLFVLEVDLADGHLSMRASSPNDAGILKTKQQMTLQALAADKQGSRVVAATNADFFTTDGSPQGVYYRNGKCLKSSMNDNVCTFFAITKEGKPMIGSYDDYESYKDKLQEAVGGRARLLTNGSILTQTSTALEPRTAIGVSDDGKVYILVVDGRNFYYSNGMRYTELATVLQALGAKDAINLDGGGSSTFVVRTEAGFDNANRFVVRNWVSDNGGVERAVANGLLVVTDN